MTTEAKTEPTAGSAGGRLPPVGFWSYARQDDELSAGKLSLLRSLLVHELQQLYGRDQIRLFQDSRTIAHGAEWEQEIGRAIDASTFFVPILTPNFVQSEWCAREVELFLEREQSLATRYPALAARRRIFPILFIGIDGAEAENPAMLAALEKLQWFDFRRFRHRSYDDAEVREAISDLAANMRDLLRLKVMDAARAAPPPASLSRTEVAAEAETTELRPNQPPASQSVPRAIAVGDRLNHMFEVKRFIKAGGMGQVFEGTNMMTGERVAIKALLPALAAEARVIEMFQREALTLTRLQHEALVQYRALAREPDLGALYIVTEYIDGTDLAEVLGRIHASPVELEALLRRLAGGLAAAHALGAVHRDISPDNVMLPGGDLNRAKIIDFGIAKDLGASQPTLIGNSFAGKLNYVAPEQLGEHGGEIGGWTDVYSLALVILAVAGGGPVDLAGSFADALRKRREGPDLSTAPASLRPLLADMLRVDPRLRVRTMDEVLKRLAAGSTPPRTAAAPADRMLEPAQEPSSHPRDPEPPRHNVLPLAAAGLGLLILIVAGLRLIQPAGPSPRPQTQESPLPSPAAPGPQANVSGGFAPMAGPSDVREFPGQPTRPARPRASLASYVTADDYPAGAIRAGEQGTTGFLIRVGPDGRATDCQVTASSGSTALDVATCRIMRTRPRFEPAQDASGRSIPDSVSGRIRWVLPAY